MAGKPKQGRSRGRPQPVRIRQVPPDDGFFALGWNKLVETLEVGFDEEVERMEGKEKVLVVVPVTYRVGGIQDGMRLMKLWGIPELGNQAIDLAVEFGVSTTDIRTGISCPVIPSRSDRRAVNVFEGSKERSNARKRAELVAALRPVG